MKPKTVVYNETNFSGLDAIRQCKREGHRVVFVTDGFERYLEWLPAESLAVLDLVDKKVEVNDSNDPEEVRAALDRELDSIEALLTFAEIRTLTTAKVCAALGLRGTDVRAVEIAQDKHLCRSVLREMSVDTVRSERADSVEELAAMRDRIAFPCFVKPVQGHSSIGSKLCRDAADFDALIPLLRSITEPWVSQAFVVEDYLEGELVSVEMLTTGPGRHEVVGVSDRDIVNDCVEIGASFPLQDVRCDAAVSKARAALDAIGFDFGGSHVELIVTADGPHLVEINTRPGGSGHTVMLDLSTGRSIVGDCVELALGTLDADTPLYGFEQGAAWRCFRSRTPGTIVSFPSAEAVKANAGVREVWFHRDVGDRVTDQDTNFSWIVQVMCTGSDRLEAKRNAARAIEFVEANTVIASEATHV